MISQVNLFVLTIFVSFINHFLNSTDIFYVFTFPFNFFSILYLLLLVAILLIKSTCFRKVFIQYVSRSSTFLRSNLNTSIIFPSFRIILLLNTLDVSYFTNCLYIFTILSIIALNFLTSKVQRNFFQLFSKNLE